MFKKFKTELDTPIVINLEEISSCGFEERRYLGNSRYAESKGYVEFKNGNKAYLSDSSTIELINFLSSCANESREDERKIRYEKEIESRKKREGLSVIDRLLATELCESLDKDVAAVCSGIFPLSARTTNALTRYFKINYGKTPTYADIKVMSYEQLCNVRNLGKASAKEVLEHFEMFKNL